MKKPAKQEPTNQLARFFHPVLRIFRRYRLHFSKRERLAIIISVVSFLIVVPWPQLFFKNSRGVVEIFYDGIENQVVEFIEPSKLKSMDEQKTLATSSGGTLNATAILGGKYSVPIPTSSYTYGIAAGSALPGFSDQVLDERMRLMKELGVNWVRLDIEWSNIQYAGQNQYNWTPADRIMIAAAKHQLNVLGIISYTPAWARDPACSGSAQCPPSDPELYAKFTGLVAKRYKDIGGKNWEIWNEPNGKQFWQSGADPGRYTTLLKAAYREIKAVDPQAKVITGGLAPQPDSGGNLSPLTFFRGIYDAGAKGSFDAVAHHPYTFPLLPSYGTLNAWQQMSRSSNSLRSEMVARGDGAKKIWLTEFGSPTNGPTAQANLNNFSTVTNTWAVDEELQSAILSDAIRLYKTYDWVGPFFYYSFKDDGTARTTNENFFGLTRTDGSHKPAYDTYKNLIK